MGEIIIPNIIINRSGTEQSLTPLSYELSNRNIYLFGEINNTCAMNILSQIHVLEDISSDPINLYINSPGGSVSDGLAICEAIEASPCIISTCCTGLGASMAAVILASGEPGNRRIGKYSEVMIHQPMGGVQGQASEISRVCDHILKIREKLAKHLSECTGRKVEELLVDMDRDYWMSPLEAKQYGLVDQIM